MMDNILVPKTPEEIADLERRGFRKSGGKWKFFIDISPLLSDYDENEDPGDFKNKMVELLNSKYDDLSSFLEEYSLMEFENVIDEFRMLDEDCDEEEVDYALNMLYDWADDNNIWLDSFNR